MRTFIKRYLPLTLAYVVIIILFSYPQILHMTTGCVELPEGGSNDQYLHMWDAWWVKAALFDYGTSPFYTHLLNYPAGASLALQEIGVFNGLLMAPFHLFFDEPHGLIFGYNVGVILSFLVSALGMYALAFHYSQNRWAAFIAGIGFMLLPYRAMHITTLNCLSTGWIPFYILFFSKTVREPVARNAIWATVIFALTLHSSNVFAFFLVLFSVVFLIAHLVTDYRSILNKKVLRAYALVAGLCFLIVVPNLIMIFAADIEWSQPVALSEFFSANVVGYVFPSNQQMVYRFLLGLLPQFEYYISGVPGHATFVSFTLLALFVYGIRKAPKKDIMPWLIIVAAFFVLSLGSRLHVWKWDTGIGLPYLLFIKYLPFSSAMRTPFRFVVVERIALLVVAAYGMKILFSRPAQDSPNEGVGLKAALLRRGILVPLLFSLLVLVELWHIPFTYVEADVPDIYYEIAESEGDFMVVDIPAKRYRHQAKYMFYQTVHKKPIPTGIINRAEEGLEDTTGGLRALLRITEEVNPELLGTLRRDGAGFVIVHSFQNGKDKVVVHDIRHPRPL